MKLEQMAAGELLEVWLDAGEPIEQVPDSLKMAGYTIDKIVAGVREASATTEDDLSEYFILQVHK
jgi:TusA-related sulfurtransferase